MGIPQRLCKQKTLGSHISSAPNPLAPPPASLPNSLSSSSCALQIPLLPLCDVVVKCKAMVLNYLGKIPALQNNHLCDFG